MARTQQLTPQSATFSNASLELVRDESRTIEIAGMTGVELALTIADTAGGDAQIQISGTGSIIVTPSLVASLVEGRSYYYNIWRLDGTDYTLLFKGTFILANSIAPSSSGAITAPVIVLVPVASGTPTTGQTLTMSDATFTGTGASITARQWLSGTTVLATGATLTLTSAHVGMLIYPRCVVTNTAGSVNADGVALGPVVAAVAPVNSVLPVVSGTVTAGQTLSTTQGTWSNSPTSYAYQWLRAGVAISGATGTSYASVTADVGSLISCRVTATNSGGSTAATSATVGPIVASVVAPTVTTAPAITGTATVGQTLTATEGTYTGSPTVTLQWLRGGVAISGATGLSYVLTSDDLAASITVQATATNAAGSVQSTSAAVGPITADWSITTTDGAITITSSPASPSTAVVASTGDGTITLAA